MKDPAFLFYPSDFLSGTMFFTDEQTGKYIRLLCAQHQHGGFLTHNQMIFICKSYDSALWSKFTKDENGNFYQHRLREEIEKRSKYCESRGNNKRGKKKPDDMKNISKSYDDHMGIGNRNIIKDISESKNGDFVSKLLKQFTDSYLEFMGIEYDIVNLGKDRSAIGKLLKIYKAKSPDQTPEQTIEGFRKFFDMSMQIEDDWIRSHMEPSIILSKLNDIKNILKNGSKRKSSKGGATDAELAANIAKHWGS